MADSTLNVDKVQNRFGTGPVDLIGQDAAKVRFKCDGGGIVLGFNTSSFTDVSVGEYEITYTNNFSTPQYTITGMSSGNGRILAVGNQQVDLVVLQRTTENGTKEDGSTYATSFGPLA